MVDLDAVAPIGFTIRTLPGFAPLDACTLALQIKLWRRRRAYGSYEEHEVHAEQEAPHTRCLHTGMLARRQGLAGASSSIDSTIPWYQPGPSTGTRPGTIELELHSHRLGSCDCTRIRYQNDTI